MANPFSGLENIGQSYLQGVQLANQRQAREEAAAQRAEDTRVRGQYYQDLVDQRRDAAALAATGRADDLARRTAADLLAGQQRDETLALRFGKNLVRDGKGKIDLIASATKLEESESQNKFYETAGLAAALGKPLQGIDEKITRSKAYQNGVALGMVEVLKNETALRRVFASQGAALITPDALPANLEPLISGPSQDTELNVLNEIRQTQGIPETLVQPPARTGLKPPPEGYQYMDIGGGNKVLQRIPKATKADRPVVFKTVKVKDDKGDETTTSYTREEVAAGLDRIVAPPASPAGTNAAPVGRLSYDQNAPFGAVYTPLKY
jgi:hypothetical protein